MFHKPTNLSLQGGSLILLLTFACQPAMSDTPSSEAVRAPASPSAEVGTEGSSRLAVLWTSGDPEVATRVAFMYTLNAKRQGWFDEVTLIVWGPSANLLSENTELQSAVQGMAEEGVELVACKACADSYGVSESLEALGIEVKYMGVPLTEMLKGDWEVITF